MTDHVPNAIQDGTNIGNVLLRLGVVERGHLEDAVLQQMRIDGNTRLGEVLMAMGAISPVDLEAAIRIQTLLRDGAKLDAELAILEFQTRRLDRSVERADALVDRGIAALDGGVK